MTEFPKVVLHRVKTPERKDSKCSQDMTDVSQEIEGKPSSSPENVKPASSAIPAINVSGNKIDDPENKMQQIVEEIVGHDKTEKATLQQDSRNPAQENVVLNSKPHDVLDSQKRAVQTTENKYDPKTVPLLLSIQVPKSIQSSAEIEISAKTCDTSSVGDFENNCKFSGACSLSKASVDIDAVVRSQIEEAFEKFWLSNCLKDKENFDQLGKQFMPFLQRHKSPEKPRAGYICPFCNVFCYTFPLHLSDMHFEMYFQPVKLSTVNQTQFKEHCGNVLSSAWTICPPDPKEYPKSSNRFKCSLCDYQVCVKRNIRFHLVRNHWNTMQQQLLDIQKKATYSEGNVFQNLNQTNNSPSLQLQTQSSGLKPTVIKVKPLNSSDSKEVNQLERDQSVANPPNSNMNVNSNGVSVRNLEAGSSLASRSNQTGEHRSRLCHDAAKQYQYQSGSLEFQNPGSQQYQPANVEFPIKYQYQSGNFQFPATYHYQSRHFERPVSVTHHRYVANANLAPINTTYQYPATTQQQQYQQAASNMPMHLSFGNVGEHQVPPWT